MPAGATNSTASVILITNDFRLLNTKSGHTYPYTSPQFWVSAVPTEKSEYDAIEIVHPPLDNVVWLTIFYQLYVANSYIES